MGPVWAWAASRPPSAAVQQPAPSRGDHPTRSRSPSTMSGPGIDPSRADQGLRALLSRVGLGTTGHGHRLRTRPGLGGGAHAPDARTGLGRVLAKRRRTLRDHLARARRRDRDPVVKRRLVLCAAIVGGLLAAGCGIPTQQQPSAVSSSRVPPGLVSPNLPSTSTTQPRASVNVTIYPVGTDGRVGAAPAGGPDSGATEVHTHRPLRRPGSIRGATRHRHRDPNRCGGALRHDPGFGGHREPERGVR